MRLIISILSFFFCTVSFSQLLDPVKWTFDTNQTGPDEHELIFIAKFDDPWKVYSQFTPEGGPVPTSINYESGNIEKLGDGTEKGSKKEGLDKIFGVDVISFKAGKPFVIKHKVKITDMSKPVTGYLTFMTCNNETCLPPTDVDFKFTFVNSNTTQNKVRNPDGKVVDPAISNPVKVKNSVPEKAPEMKPAKKGIKIAPIKESNIPQEPKVVKNNIEPVQQKIKPIETGGQIALNTDAVDFGGQEKMIDPVNWSFDIQTEGNNEYALMFKADMQDEWTVYSLYTDDNGPYPTSVTYEGEEEVILLGDATENGKKKEGPDPLFDNVQVIKYLSGKPFVITQRIASPKQSKITGYLTYMACNNEGCLPPTDVDFVFDPKSMKAGLKADMVSTASAVSAPSGDIAMNLNGNQIDQKIPALIDSYAEPIGDCGTQIKDANENYWKIFIGGFLGGLVAILLPCIFPMIPITVSFFTKDTKTKGWVNGLIYGLSIIGIFVALGLAVTAILGPTALNTLSTSAIANIIFFLIFVAFAISFFGYFEITLPSSWSTKTDSMADKGGLLGTFFMAATLAIVSFSCTGPIIGTALVQVADKGLMGPFFIMLGFSTALAIPFGLFAAFPAWLNSLPRSGSWMTSVKVVLGFLELALALKFLSVADMTNNWGVLKYELFMGLWVIIFAAMTAYLFGLFRFPHDSPVKKLSLPRKAFAILSLLWTIYIALGFRVDPNINSYKIPKLVSGITPPASYNFFLAQNESDADIKSRYPSYTKCANDINCFKDYYEAIAYANEVDKPVLIDFTGHGCVNCRKTEDYIWKDLAIKGSLNDDFVLASLYVDDRKKLDEILESVSRDVKLRNVGNKWADFQIVNFKQNSQPLYVPITKDQKVITPPRGYEEGVENYKQFLDCALDINKNNAD